MLKLKALLAVFVQAFGSQDSIESTTIQIQIPTNSDDEILPIQNSTSILYCIEWYRYLFD